MVCSGMTTEGRNGITEAMIIFTTIVVRTVGMVPAWTRIISIFGAINK